MATITIYEMHSQNNGYYFAFADESSESEYDIKELVNEIPATLKDGYRLSESVMGVLHIYRDNCAECEAMTPSEAKALGILHW